MTGAATPPERRFLVPGGEVVLTADGHTVSVYAGLPPLDACALDTVYYRERAAEFGHGADLDGFVRVHELAHHALAAVLRLKHSPTLFALARRAAADDPTRVPFYRHWRLEEAAVEALARWAQAAGIDLATVLAEAAS